MKAVKIIAWVVVGIAVVIGLVMVRQKRINEKKNAPLIKPLPMAVRVTGIVNGQVHKTTHVLGTIIGMNETMLAPRIMARILDIKVREGDKVKKGQKLVSLDPREIEDAVAQARAKLNAARSGEAAAHTGYIALRDANARNKKLFNAKAISKEQWDRSRSMLAAAKARLDAAKAGVIMAQKQVDRSMTQLGYTTLRSPFDGSVAARLKDPGDLALPGRPILKLVRGDAVRARAEVPGSDFTLMKVGMEVRISTDTQAVNARVSRIFPAMGRNHLAAFEADLESPPPGFVSGMPVAMDLRLSGAEGLKVPADALLDSEKGSFVFVVRKGKAHPVKVKVLGRSLDAAIVKAGNLHVNDRVIIARPSRLMTIYDGESVTVSSENTAKKTGKVTL